MNANHRARIAFTVGLLVAAEIGVGRGMTSQPSFTLEPTIAFSSARLDSELVRHMKLPKDFDAAVRTTATFDLYDAVREAARGHLSETSAALGSLRNQAGFQSSPALAVIAVAAAIGLVVAIVVLFV